MNSAVSSCIKSLAEKVQQASGKKVKFIERTELAGAAELSVATKSMAEHIVYFDRRRGELTFHALARECLRIVRLFEAEPEKRIVPMSTEEMRLSALEELAPELAPLREVFRDKELAKMCDLWFDRVVRQVTTLPGTIMIEQWLFAYYPEMRPLQLAAARADLARAHDDSSPQVRQMTPAKIYASTNIMNYAYFSVLDRFLEANLASTFKDDYIKTEGYKLAALFDADHPDSYEGDVTMIHLWAELLDIASWFAWLNFDSLE